MGEGVRAAVATGPRGFANSENGARRGYEA
eukprot:COSAG01_NODE_32521_length_579_cov_5.797917_2_plen_29_part_01